MALDGIKRKKTLRISKRFCMDGETQTKGLMNCFIS